MAIEKICSDSVKNKKLIKRNYSANLIGMGVKCLIQYKSNPSGKGPIMFYIPEEAIKFNVFIKRYGGLTNYSIEAMDSEGNTLNTFHFLA